MSRPACVHCGKPYGQRASQLEAVRWQGDEDSPPPYRGNGVVIRYRYHGFNDGQFGPRVVEGTDVPAGQHVAHRDVWDGETWRGGYDPFCTLRCALDYARHIYYGAKNAKPRVVSRR